MADKKITELPAVTALDADDLIPVVEDGTTKKATITEVTAAEAALARNADNLTSGTVADARIASTIARDTEVTTALETAAFRKNGFPSSSYFEVPVTVASSSNQTQAATTNQTAFWMPCYLPRTATIVEFATYCWASEASSTLRFGIYANTGTGLAVGSLTQDFGTVSGASTGNKTLAGTQAMSAGWFWACTWVSNHTTVRWNRRQVDPDWSPFGTVIAFGRVNLGYYASAVDYSAGLPGSPPALTILDHSTAPGINTAFPYWRYT